MTPAGLRSAACPGRRAPSSPQLWATAAVAVLFLLSTLDSGYSVHGRGCLTYAAYAGEVCAVAVPQRLHLQCSAVCLTRLHVH